MRPHSVHRWVSGAAGVARAVRRARRGAGWSRCGVGLVWGAVREVVGGCGAGAADGAAFTFAGAAPDAPGDVFVEGELEALGSHEAAGAGRAREVERFAALGEPGVGMVGVGARRVALPRREGAAAQCSLLGTVVGAEDDRLERRVLGRGRKIVTLAAPNRTYGPGLVLREVVDCDRARAATAKVARWRPTAQTRARSSAAV